MPKETPPSPSVQKVVDAVRGKRLFQASDLEIGEGELQTIIDQVVGDKGALDRLAQIFPPDKLERLIRADFPSHVDAVQTAKEMVEEAKFFLEKTEVSGFPLKARVKDVVGSVLQGIESVIQAFGISEFFRPAESHSDARLKAQLVMMLLQFSMLLSTIALPILGDGIAGTVIGCTLLSVALLSMIYPYIRPMPQTILKTENWTRQIHLQKMEVPEGRRAEVKEIADALIASRTTKRGFPLLIGKTGVGKTQTAKVFAASLERGDFPELKGKAVFYINTADFVSGMEAHKALLQLSEILGRHRENVILVWDEIHLACKKGSGILSEQLKKMIGDEFPYCIGITTEEAFHSDIYIENPAFADRFKEIAIQNTKSGETLQILESAFLKEAPSVLIEPNALNYLMKKTKEAFGSDAAEPATSLRILSRCLKETAATQKTPLEKQIEEVRSQIDALQAELLASGVRPSQKRQEIQALFEQFSKLEAELVQDKRAVAKLIAERERYLELTTKIYRAAIHIANHPKSAKRSHFLLATHYGIPALEANIQGESQRLGIRSSLDKKLIDKVIVEEKAAQQRANQLRDQGKAKAILRN